MPSYWSSHCKTHFRTFVASHDKWHTARRRHETLARLCSRYHSPTSSARRPAYGAARSSARSGASGTSLGAISLFRSCRYLLQTPASAAVAAPEALAPYMDLLGLVLHATGLGQSHARLRALHSH